jgi:hypothetical protein
MAIGMPTRTEVVIVGAGGGGAVLGLALAASIALAFNMPKQIDDHVFADHPVEGPIEISGWERRTHSKTSGCGTDHQTDVAAGEI